MKIFLIILLALTASIACSMSKRSRRLITPVDEKLVHWWPCNEKMVKDWRGKFCLVKCAIKLKKDGSCKDDKYLYIAKDFKENHEFFSGHVLMPQDRAF